MIINNTITHYEKDNGYKNNFYDVYLEQQYGLNDTKEGEKKSHALFISVPTEKELPFKVGDIVVIGRCSVRFSDNEKMNSENYRKLKKEYNSYTISSVEPCLIGSKHMWHYELECD